MVLVFLAILLIIAAFVVPPFVSGGTEKLTVRFVALALALVFILSTSFTIIGADEVGHLKRIYLGGSMPPGGGPMNPKVHPMDRNWKLFDDGTPV